MCECENGEERKLLMGECIKSKSKSKKILKPRAIHDHLLAHMIPVVPVTGSREDKVTHWQDNREGAIHERHTKNAGAGDLGEIRLRIGVRSRVGKKTRKWTPVWR